MKGSKDEGTSLVREAMSLPVAPSLETAPESSKPRTFQATQSRNASEQPNIA